MLGTVRDALLLRHPAHGGRNFGAGDPHRTGLSRVESELHLRAETPSPQHSVDQHRRLVRGSRTLVGGRRREDQDPPVTYLFELVTQPSGAVEGAERVPRLSKAGYRVHGELGAERDDEMIPWRTRPLTTASRREGSMRSTSPRTTSIPLRSRRASGRVTWPGRRSPLMTHRKDAASAKSVSRSTRTTRCRRANRLPSRFARTTPPMPPSRIRTVCSFMKPRGGSEDQHLVRRGRVIEDQQRLHRRRSCARGRAPRPASTGSPASRHSGKPCFRRTASTPRLRSSRTASAANTQ